MINVLYLSYDGMTDPLGQSQVIPYLQGLTKQGYFFTVVSFEKPERLREHQGQLSQLLLSSGIAWVPLIYHKKPPVLSTLYDIHRLRKKAYQLHQKYNFRIIHCRSYLAALVGMAIKRDFGVKFVFDMRGFWADERVEGGLWNLDNPVYQTIYSYFKKREKELLNEADHTVTLTHKAQDIIHQWKGIKNQPIPVQVIPCCVDTELFDPKKVEESDQASLRQKLRIPSNAVVLSYLGSLGTWYMVEEMLAYFKVVQQSFSNAFFLFITKDSSEEIYRYCKKYSIDPLCIITASATRKEVPLYLSISTWSVFFIKPVFSKQASSATKLGEIISMGIPFVTNRGIGDSDTLVEKNEVGLLTSLGEYSDLATATENLHKLPAERIRATAIKYFSLQRGIVAYGEVYRQLMQNGEKHQMSSLM